MGYKSQANFAAAISPKLDQSRVSDWERGVHLPEGQYRKRLLEVLGSPETLLDVEPEAAPPINIDPILVQNIAKELISVVRKDQSLRSPVSPYGTISPELDMIYEAWNDPHLGEERRALALWLLTSEKKYLKIFSAEWIERIVRLVAAAKINPRRAQSKAPKKAAR